MSEVKRWLWPVGPNPKYVVLASDYDNLRDENARLRRALEPFAAMGRYLDEREFVNLYERSCAGGKRLVISMKDLKRAALAGQEGES